MNSRMRPHGWWTPWMVSCVASACFATSHQPTYAPAFDGADMCSGWVHRRVQAFPWEPCTASRATPRPTGTTNFVHRYPFSCVSVGLTIGKRPVVGVVFNPILGEEGLFPSLFSHVRSRSGLSSTLWLAAEARQCTVAAAQGCRQHAFRRRASPGSRASAAPSASRVPSGTPPQHPCVAFVDPRHPPCRRAVSCHPCRRRVPQRPAHPGV